MLLTAYEAPAIKTLYDHCFGCYRAISCAVCGGTGCNHWIRCECPGPSAPCCHYCYTDRNNLREVDGEAVCYCEMTCAVCGESEDEPLALCDTCDRGFCSSHHESYDPSGISCDDCTGSL